VHLVIAHIYIYTYIAGLHHTIAPQASHTRVENNLDLLTYLFAWNR
jgi:hypothetical protein